MAPPKREAPASQSLTPKRPRQVKKVFVSPDGWELTPGFQLKKVHTARCDMNNCGRHVMDDNPAKQCKCGLNVCWVCEQARGGLHVGLQHDCVHYKRAMEDVARGVRAVEPGDQPSLPSNSQLSRLTAPKYLTPAVQRDDLSRLSPSASRTVRGGSAPASFCGATSLEKDFRRMQGTANQQPGIMHLRDYPARQKFPEPHTSASLATLLVPDADRGKYASLVQASVAEAEPVDGTIEATPQKSTATDTKEALSRMDSIDDQLDFLYSHFGLKRF